MRPILFFIVIILANPIPVWAAVLPVSQGQTETEIYRNKKYGFEIRYPKDFAVGEKFDDTGKFEYTELMPPAGVKGNIYISYNDPSYPGLYASKGNSPISFLGISQEAFAAIPGPGLVGEVRVDTVKGSHEVVDFGNGEWHRVYFKNNGVRFEISAQWGHVSDFPPQGAPKDYSRDRKVIMEAFDKILSSFKFTKDRF